MRDYLHNNQTKCIYKRPSCLLKHFTSPFTNDEFSTSPPEDKVTCVLTRHQQITNYKDLTIEHANFSDFKKKINVSCVCLPGFLNFYDTLRKQCSNHKILLSSVDNIESKHLTQSGKINADVLSCLSITVHLFISKQNVFKPKFKEGINTLSLKSDGLKF